MATPTSVFTTASPRVYLLVFYGEVLGVYATQEAALLAQRLLMKSNRMKGEEKEQLHLVEYRVETEEDVARTFRRS